ncbi:hypothetical protein C4565_10570 [Candidatus Parcubacteria bacterium]|nr:MAG: hypothetical protein C4565_10570 [Candidatus Parcubacteria bacterium]
MKIRAFIIAQIICCAIMGLGIICPAYSAEIWCNPTNTGVENGESKLTGYNTLHEALAVMSSNDTAIISNGDWRNTAGMYIDRTHRPPDGTGGGYSKIQAETDWGVKLPYINIETLYSEPHGYIEIRGIVFDNKFIGTGIGHIVYHMNHFKYIRCGFLAHGVTGNNHAAGFGNSNSDRRLNQYNLMEECIIWGSGRYMQYSKYGQYNIFRRCVIRHDYHDGLGGQDDGQIFNYRAYACDYHIYQNCISIDSDRTQYFSSLQSEAGGFWPGDSYGATGNAMYGCISIKDVHLPYYIAGNGSGFASIENSIALDVTVPGYTTLSAFVLKNNITLSAKNLLAIKALQDGQDGVYGKNLGAYSLTDSIIRDVNEYGIFSATGLNINHFNAGIGNFGENPIDSDPLLNGLSYPIRVEEGSPLATAGVNGGPVGPSIMKKIGISGKLYGEPGWDTLTNENLWPFPNEDKIKELMSETVEGVSGIYGFTSGNSLDGTPQTLTKYIWEYLRNKIPEDIYSRKPLITKTSIQ